jgi:hypothetical protein
MKQLENDCMNVHEICYSSVLLRLPIRSSSGQNVIRQTGTAHAHEDLHLFLHSEVTGEGEVESQILVNSGERARLVKLCVDCLICSSLALMNVPYDSSDYKYAVICRHNL